MEVVMSFFDKLKSGLEKTKSSFNNKISSAFSGFKKVDEELLEELEEILIMSDFGVDTSVNIIGKLRDRIKREKIEDTEAVKKALKEEIENILCRGELGSPAIKLETKPTIILIVGVNGVRKNNINR